jgi:hypothetical protein
LTVGEDATVLASYWTIGSENTTLRMEFEVYDEKEEEEG